ncbi:MAG: rhodanese-like domain-containing protein [Pseudomonadota bacterium]
MQTHAQDPPVGDTTLLHRLCSSSLGGDGVTMAPAMQLALDASFGSVDRWRADFAACARARGVGPGWMLLVFRHDGSLVHQWAADHSHVAAGGVPILALGLHGQAHPGDDGAAVGACIDAWLGQLHWAAVHARYQQAVDAASAQLGVDQDGLGGALGGALVLDVRRAGAYAQASTTLPGARWCNPAVVADWSTGLPADRPVVVYCVHGHEVSRATALRLHAAGLQARYLRGGIDGWQVAGLPLVGKPAEPAA